jgi:hypothetical protein
MVTPLSLNQPYARCVGLSDGIRQAHRRGLALAVSVGIERAVTPLPMMTEERPVQLLKAQESMVFTQFGMAIDVRPVPSKAASPMVVTKNLSLSN